MVYVLDAANPIDGDPDRIESCSRYYSDIASAIQATAANLEAVINTSDTVSDAVEAFVHIAGEVRGNLVEVDGRYDTIATQLSSYSSHLRRLQGDADAVMAAARHAHEDHDSTQWRVRQLRDQIEAGEPTDPALAGLQYHLDRAESGLLWIEQVVSAKNEELEALLELWRATADMIAATIRDAVDGSSLNDSGWDQFLDILETVVSDVLPIIEMVLDILALVLTIAAFILAVTGVGAPLAAALFTVARLAQLGAKIAKIARITVTIVLVVSGKKTATALIDIALDVALDKAMGGATDRIGAGVLAGAKELGAGEWLSTAARQPGSFFAVQNLDQMVNGGFDTWANNGFKEFMDVGIAGFPDGFSSAFADIDSGLGRADQVLDAYLAAMGFSFEKGPDLAYGAADFNGSAWDVIDTALDFADPTPGLPDLSDFAPIPDKDAMIEDHVRPSSDDLVDANS